MGEGTVEDRELAVRAAIQHTESYLIGQDPFRIGYHIETLSRESYWRTGALLRSASSAIEMALLEIKGKALGVPGYYLLGGLQCGAVPCYPISVTC